VVRHHKARTELGWEPRHSNASAVIASYDWFLGHRGEPGAGPRSHHQSPGKLGQLEVLKRVP
jgi:hypothetical protein